MEWPSPFYWAFYSVMSTSGRWTEHRIGGPQFADIFQSCHAAILIVASVLDSVLEIAIACFFELDGIRHSTV